MTITVTTPTSLRRPGAYSEFKFLQSGAALTPLPLRAVIIAEKSSAGTATADVPIQVFDEDDGDTKCGKGSFAALAVRKAIEQGKLSGASPEIWVAPIAEPSSGGVAAVETITVTVTTALGGDLTFTVCGRLVTVGVSAGHAQNTIATGIKDALDAMKSTLPITAGVSANVVTCTTTTKGVNGNDVEYALVSAPSGVTVVFAQSVAGTGAAVITTAVQSLYNQRYHAVIVANHTTVDVATLLIERAASWGIGQKNWRFFFMGERGSLGTAQTLATAANDFGIVIGSYEKTPSLPVEIAVTMAIAEYAREAPNANLDGERVALYPANGTYAYTAAEVESGLNGGLTVFTPDGAFSKIERMMTSQVTYNSAPTETVRDIAFPRTVAFRAEQVETAFRQRFRQETINTSDPDNNTLLRVRAMVIDIDRAMESLGYLRDVDSFVKQILVEAPTTPPGRITCAAPMRVAGPLHQGVFVHTMYL